MRLGFLIVSTILAVHTSNEFVYQYIVDLDKQEI